MQEQLPRSINHFQHTLNSYKTHHNGIFKNALSPRTKNRHLPAYPLFCQFGQIVAQAHRIMI